MRQPRVNAALVKQAAILGVLSCCAVIGATPRVAARPAAHLYDSYVRSTGEPGGIWVKGNCCGSVYYDDHYDVPISLPDLDALLMRRQSVVVLARLMNSLVPFVESKAAYRFITTDSNIRTGSHRPFGAENIMLNHAPPNAIVEQVYSGTLKPGEGIRISGVERYRKYVSRMDRRGDPMEVGDQRMGELGTPMEVGDQVLLLLKPDSPELTESNTPYFRAGFGVMRPGREPRSYSILPWGLFWGLRVGFDDGVHIHFNPPLREELAQIKDAQRRVRYLP